MSSGPLLRMSNMESHIFVADGIVLEFADGYRIPTTEEWNAAAEKSKDYTPPEPPIYVWSRLEQALIGAMMLQGVIHGNIADLSELYRVENILRTWSGIVSTPPDATAQETSEPILPTIPTDQL